MTATTAGFPHFTNNDCLDLAQRSDIICSGGVRQGFVDTFQGHDRMDSEHNLDNIPSYGHSEYTHKPRCTCPMTSSVKATGNRHMKGVKRQRSPFGIEMRPPSCKWIRLESYPGSSDVINRTSDLEDRNIEQGASSGIPSPVDDDDKSNDSLDPGVSFEDDDTMSHDYISFYQYEEFQDIRNSVCIGDTQSSWNVDNNVYGVINSRLLSQHRSMGVQTRDHHMTFTERSRNPGPREDCGKSVAVKSVCHELNSHTCHKSKTNVNIGNIYLDCGLVSSDTGCTMAGMEINKSALPRTKNQFMAEEWERKLKVVNGFLVVLGSDLTILDVSTNVSDCLGFHQHQLIGQSITLFIYPSHHSLLRNITCSSQRNKGKRTIGRLPGSRHTFPVDMRFEFQHDDSSMRSGFLAVQWYLRSMPSTGADNCSSEKNVVSIICLPYITSLSLASQRKFETVLGRQDWNLFRTRHPTTSDVRHLIVNCPYNCCSLITVTCLSCMESLLMAGCAMSTYRATRSDRCVNNWCVTFANTANDCESPKCVVCRCVDRKNDIYGGELKMMSKSPTHWKLSASSGRISFSRQSLYSDINHREKSRGEKTLNINNRCQLSHMKEDKMFNPFHETSHCHKFHDLDALFQCSQGNPEVYGESDQSRLQQGTFEMNGLMTKTRNDEGKVCSAIPIQEGQHFHQATNLLFPNAPAACLKDFAGSTFLKNPVFPVQTKSNEILCDDNTIQHVHFLPNSLSLPSLAVSPSTFPQQSSTCKYSSVAVHVGNQASKPMSTSVDIFEWYKKMADSQSSFSFMNEESESDGICQSSSVMPFQNPVCQNVTNQYNYLKCSSQFLEDGNIHSNSKPGQTCELSEIKQNHHWPILEIHNSSHEATKQPDYSYPSLSSRENRNKNIQPLICPPNVNMEGLEEIDFTSEFPFPGSDVVMPVEHGIECVNDLVLNSSNKNIMDLNPVNDSIQMEGSLDPFTAPSSNDFTDPLDVEMHRQNFEPFDPFLSFSSSDFTPSSISISNSISFSADRNTEVKECSNRYLIKQDGVVPQNKNPFKKYPETIHQPTSPQNCYSTLLELFSPSTEKKNQSKSLLRTLLKKDEIGPQAASEWKQQPLQHSGLSQSYHSDFHHESKSTFKTKELPVPNNPSSKRIHRHSCPPIATQELPLPCNAVSKPLTFRLSSQNRSSSFDSCRSSGEDRDVEKLACSNGDNLSTFNNSVNSDSLPMNGLLNEDNDTLPDDLLDLAIEYCSSLDSKQTESFMTELNEPFSWDGNLDLLNPSSSIDSFCQTSSCLEPNSLKDVLDSHSQNPQLGIKNCYNSQPVHNGKLSVCLPISNKLTPNTQTASSPSINKLATSLLPSASLDNHVSLLRQAVTSPDVDKLIQQIPLGRRLMFKKCRSSNVNKCDDKQDRDVNVHKLHNCLQSQDTSKHPAVCKPRCPEFLAKDRQCSSSVDCVKTSAVSHISISTPPHCPSKKSHIKPRVSPIKLKISSSSGIGKQKGSKTDSSSLCKKNTKMSNCPNSSSEPVSVMVMRKENHRVRRCKTVAVQTNNNPDEVYPVLELSPSDVFLTPSVYLDTSHSLPSPKSSTTLSKSPLNTSHIFPSPSRNTVSPKDSLNLTTSSLIFKHTSPSSSSSSSSSSLSELEQHLRGMITPSSNTPSSSSSEAEISSCVPFLQRLLTGELSKDRYEKLDKDLLNRQRPSSKGH